MRWCKKMERKLRIRGNEIDAKVMLLKLLPWIFMLLMFLAINSSGLAVAGAGPLQGGME
jgi:hypothetical protein